MKQNRIKAVKRILKRCVRDVFFDDELKMQELLNFNSETTPYQGVFTRTDNEIDLLTAQKLGELWNLATPYARGKLSGFEIWSKKTAYLRVHGEDSEAFGGKPVILEAKNCQLTDEEMSQLTFPTYIKYNFGVSATARGKECFKHMSFVHDLQDLKAKLPFFCLPTMDQFVRFGRDPAIVDKQHPIITPFLLGYDVSVEIVVYHGDLVHYVVRVMQLYNDDGIQITTWPAILPGNITLDELSFDEHKQPDPETMTKQEIMRLSLGRLVRRVVKENHMWNHLAAIYSIFVLFILFDFIKIRFFRSFM